MNQARNHTAGHEAAGRLISVVGRARPPGSPRRAQPASEGDPPVRAGLAPADWRDDRGDETNVPGIGGDGLDRPAAATPLTRLLGIGRAHMGALVIVLLVAVIFAATRIMAATGHDVQPAVVTPEVTPAAIASSATPSNSVGSATPVVSEPPAQLRVHVLGAVASPRVVVLVQGARVADALSAAGGLAPDADCAELNLAAPVSDGDQLIIGTRAAPRGELRAPGGSAPQPASGGSTKPGTAGQAATVNLNTATVEQLDGLPGVGPVTAQRILAWRDQHGRFTRVEQLQEVDGIGAKTYAQLAPLVRV